MPRVYCLRRWSEPLKELMLTLASPVPTVPSSLACADSLGIFTLPGFTRTACGGVGHGCGGVPGCGGCPGCVEGGGEGCGPGVPTATVLTGKSVSMSPLTTTLACSSKEESEGISNVTSP
jgi:hypothetical protein